LFGWLRAIHPSDLRSQTYCGESAFDRIRGAQVHPMLGRVSIEFEQHIGVIDDLGDPDSSGSR
jgi:hypothetical protein